MPVVLLVRHGQASFGSADYDVLSETGARQMAALHRALPDGAARLVAGTLRRQRDSARPWGDDPETDPRWDEYDSEGVLRAHAEAPEPPGAGESGSGTLTTRGFQRILDPALARWIEAGPDSPAAEAWPDFRARCVGALHDLAGALTSGQTGIAFTSGGVIAACAAALLEAPDRVFVALNRVAVNSAVTKVLVGRGGLSLVSYNEHGHLGPEEVTYR